MEIKTAKNNIIETIRNIRTARVELQKAIKAERLACTPILADVSTMPLVYKLFCEQMGERKFSADDRRVFIFIAQYLYDPRCLFGRKMKRGLRNAIANVLNVRGVSTISDVIRTSMFNYQTYTGFRTLTNQVLGKIMERLREIGVIV